VFFPVTRNKPSPVFDGGYEKTTTTAIPCLYSCDSCRITFCGQETCDCSDTCNSVCSNGGNCC
jgi:hypothetical protein